MDGDPGPRSPKERRCLSRRRESALSSCNQDAEAPGGPGLRLRLRLSRLRLLLQSLSSAIAIAIRNSQGPRGPPRPWRLFVEIQAERQRLARCPQRQRRPKARRDGLAAAPQRGWAPAREPRKLRRGKSQEERDACCSAVVLLCWQQHKPGPYKPCCRRRRACQRRGSGHRHGLGICLKTTLRAHPASAQLKPPQPQSLTIGRGAAHGVGT